MRFQKILALVMAVSMFFALGGCSVPKMDMASAEPAVPAETSAPAENTPAEEVKTLDFDGAFAAYDPDTVVFYVGDTGVTWQELFYQIAFYAAYISSLEGKAITDWNDTCSFFLDEEGNPVPYGAVVMQNATGILLQYHIMDNHFKEAGIVLSEEALAAVELVRQTTIDQSFGGDEAAFLAYLESLYCTEEIWNWYNQVDALYNYDGFEHFSGEMGGLLPDEEVIKYAAGDGDGAWAEYVQLKLICIYDEGENTAEEEASGEASAEPAEDASEEASQDPAAEEEVDAQALLVQILNAEDREAVFDELYARYNEESQMDHYPEGRCVFQGDINETIYQTALTMEIGDCRLVSLEGTDVILMKMPVDPDGGVYYDEATGTMHTLRYFAARQAYAEMTGGKGGWIATDAANAKWAEGFEDFSLDMVF